MYINCRTAQLHSFIHQNWKRQFSVEPNQLFVGVFPIFIPSKIEFSLFLAELCGKYNRFKFILGARKDHTISHPSSDAKF